MAVFQNPKFDKIEVSLKHLKLPNKSTERSPLWRIEEEVLMISG
jgi:hypothetical protein